MVDWSELSEWSESWIHNDVPPLIMQSLRMLQIHLSPEAKLLPRINMSYGYDNKVFMMLNGNLSSVYER